MTTDKGKRLYRRVADELAQAIGAGVYPVAERLPTERDLAEALGVSRPTVREALIALEIMGLVEVLHGSGIYVKALPGQTGALRANEDLDVGAFELIEARMIIEGETAAIAATLATDQDVEQLAQLVHAMSGADSAESEKADREFHLYLARITDNGALIDTIAHLWDLRATSRLASTIMTRAQGGGADARRDEHTDILQAVKERNPAKARQSMREHLEKVRDYVLDATETAELENLKQQLRAKRDGLARRTGY